MCCAVEQWHETERPAAMFVYGEAAAFVGVVVNGGLS